MENSIQDTLAELEVEVEVVQSKDERQTYSVWAIPTDDVSCRIKKLMEGLRAEFGGPEIEPHIALAGSIRLSPDNMLKKFEALEDPIQGYIPKVEAVITRRSYYQCVCILFQRPYYKKMYDILSNTSGHFDISNPDLPHLALLYGNLTEEERKRAKEKVSILDESITDLSFPIASVALYKTSYQDKTLKSWEKIAEKILRPR
ncbi:cyclic phosphodiesterase-like [Prunus yedoensis var. nudiflora]|uniref:Cyclic phosphodiesterase-like n=1 Tax=Prunus yedoensis var. nudiflora TaxID=2094558 RepID=A0A314XNG4_PRUYE|nr:cyclic phosphodiesterase-like [Prunus yedoensis var. nudiflora]